jgi:hypothetical protein
MLTYRGSYHYFLAYVSCQAACQYVGMAKRIIIAYGIGLAQLREIKNGYLLSLH